VLIRDFAGVLDADGQAFCREVLLKYASRSFQTDYRYQIGDGVDAALDALPYLLKASPKSRDEVRRALLFTLLDNQPAGMGQRFSDHSVSAIRNLWSENAADAQALFLGFLYLKPKFDALWERMRQRRFQDGMHPFSTLSLFQQFDKEHHKDIAEGISGKVSYDDLSSANDVTLDTLVTGVLLLPLETTDQRHTLFMREAAVRVVQEMTKRDRAEDRFDPAARHRFLRRFAGFVLSREPEDVTTYVQPFVESLIKLNHGDEVFQQFLSAQVELNRYDSFWKVWDLFYPSVVKLARKGGSGRRSSEVIHNYLFAWPYWRKGIKGWDTLKDREKVFFKRVAEDIGDDPDVLYALAKALNEVAAPFEAEGIFWISGVIERNPRIADAELETDAIYYLENFVRGYVLRNRHKVRTTPQVKERVLVILNFLLQKASVTAYLIREDIL
jgi:hypothetical protein